MYEPGCRHQPPVPRRPPPSRHPHEARATAGFFVPRRPNLSRCIPANVGPSWGSQGANGPGRQGDGPMALTDTAIRNAKPRAKPYKLADGAGLYLEVMPTGARYWRFRYRIAGKDTRLAFGVYPERSEEHTSELQSLMRISYAVFCLKKKKKTT